MKNPKKLFLLIGLLVFAALIGIVTTTSHKSAPSAQKNIYYCPMHPNYTSDKPGTCPICNMSLVKRETTPEIPAQSKASQTDAKRPKDICLLHNCPMFHDGKQCPMLVVAKEGEKITCPICKQHIAEMQKESKGHEKKILYWTDPMIPGYKADKPGKSPMGMDLVAVYEEESLAASTATAPQGYASILVTPQKQQLIGIKTAPVEKKKLVKSIRTVGTIAHDPELY